VMLSNGLRRAAPSNTPLAAALPVLAFSTHLSI
jgi:hypothetical protein